jgi:hypothetical protein
MALALLVCYASPAFAESLAAGTARNVTGGVLVVVRADGVEARLRGRGALRVFDGDTLRVDGAGSALVETDEGVHLALNGNAAARLISRWEKGAPVTRILRLQRGEVWARVDDGRRAIEIETPVGMLAARAAEVSVKLVSDNEAVATVVKGAADFITPFASCQIRAGTASSAQRGKACTPPAAAEVRPITGWSHPLLAQ